jgi:hypothetical protein
MSQAQGSNGGTQRGWTSVVASGTSAGTGTNTSSSVFAPKPSTSLTEAPGSSAHSLTLGAGSSLSRTASPAHVPSEPVPEDWEDDV